MIAMNEGSMDLKKLEGLLEYFLLTLGRIWSIHERVKRNAFLYPLLQKGWNSVVYNRDPATGMNSNELTSTIVIFIKKNGTRSGSELAFRSKTEHFCHASLINFINSYEWKLNKEYVESINYFTHEHSYNGIFNERPKLSTIIISTKWYNSRGRIDLRYSWWKVRKVSLFRVNFTFAPSPNISIWHLDRFTCALNRVRKWINTYTQNQQCTYFL